MRNVEDNDATDGPGPEDDTAEMYGSPVPRGFRRSKRAVAGVAGLAAVLGAGAFAVTTMIDNAHRTETGEVGALAPAQPEGAQGSARVGSPADNTPSAIASSAATSTAKSAARRAAEARAANEKAGTEIRPPVPPKRDVKPVAAKDLKVKTTGTVEEDRKMLRVVSAREDLSGQHELGWVADNGEVVGNARCSQNFRFAGGTPIKEKPSLLVCWRLSKKKSVYTVAVKIGGRPSKAQSVAAIDKAWAKL